MYERELSNKTLTLGLFFQLGNLKWRKDTFMMSGQVVQTGSLLERQISSVHIPDPGY